MQVESMSSRLDFDERRARALEGVVQYRPGAVPPLQPPISSGAGRAPETEAQAQERRTRRRRRRGRRPASARESGAASYGEASASAPAESGGGYGETGAAREGSGSREPVSPKPLSEGGGEGG